MKQWPDWSTEETLMKTAKKNGLQPTDEQMFGHLVAKPEELAKQDEDWGNRLGDFYKSAQKPVGTKFDPNGKVGRGSILADMTEEERKERNAYTKE